MELANFDFQYTKFITFSGCVLCANALQKQHFCGLHARVNYIKENFILLYQIDILADAV